MACVRGSFLLLLFVHCAVSQQNHCGEPTKYLDKRLDNRYLHKIHFTDGNRVAYSCLPGYTRTRGSRMSFCKNGRWTALDMTCDKKKCNRLTELENGQYRQNGLSFGDEAFAVCNDGYVLKGEKVRVCEEMGWSGQDPICVLSQQNHCGEPTIYLDKRLDNRYLHKIHFTDGNRVAYSCLPGYTRTRGSRMSFCKNGRWTALDMTCDKKKCNRLTELENGQYRQNGLSFGDEAFAVCNDGYVLKGEKVRVCEEMGWSGQDPICVLTSVPQKVVVRFRPVFHV